MNVAAGVKLVRVFVSSPTDAQFERARLERVAERLNGEFQSVARLVPVRWETEHFKAHATFQAQVPEAAQCEIVVAIFRGRLGTVLPDDFPRMPNGAPYPSGSAYEVLSAIGACKEHGLPDVYVFRFPQPPSVQLDDPERAQIEAQWERLKGFFDTWFRTPQGQFKAAFHTFQSTDDFEAQAEALLRKWLEDKVLHGRSVAWPAEIKGSPFCGLAAFGAKHAPVFFGRSRDIARAVDELKDAAERGCPFLLLEGPSGAGKSSLLRAGLVPRLTAPGVVPSVDVWRVAVMRPGEIAGDPFAALARQLFLASTEVPESEEGRPQALPELAQGDFPRPEDLAALLRHADEAALRPLLSTLAGLEQLTRESQGYDRPVRAALLLAVDQLDDLFAADVGDEVRARFARLLALLARSGAVWLVVTLRAGLLDRFLEQGDLKGLKEAGATYDLVPPGHGELAEIVRAPAAAANIAYEVDAATGMGLDERLLADAERPDMLPLLQFTLGQLFASRERGEGGERLTYAAYRALGGLGGAVEKEAEAAFGKLGAAEQAALPRLLRELVVPSAPRADGSFVTTQAGFDIRSAPLAQAAHDPSARRLVEALVDARILLLAEEGREATVRLAHARVLDSWKRAGGIVAENADFYRIRAEVEEQRRRWDAGGHRRDQLIGRGRPLAEAESLVRRFGQELPAPTRDFVRRSSLRARLSQTLTAAAAVLFAAVAVVAVVEWRTAVGAQRAAEQVLTAATATANGLVFDVARRFRNALGVPASLIRDILDRTRTLQDQLTASGQVTPELRRSEAAALTETADTLLTIGDTAGALRAADRARQILEALVAINPASTGWQRDLSVCYGKVGDVLVAQGKLEAALDSYRKGLAIRERLAASDRGNTEWQRDLSVSHDRVGDVLVAQGKLDEALDSFRKGLAIHERLAASDRSNTVWQRDLSVSYNKVGDVLVAQGKLDEALDSFRKGLAIVERLTASNQGNTEWQRDLSVSYDRVGDVLAAQGRLDEALDSFRKGLAIVERLAASDLSNTVWQRDLSVSYNKVGGVLVAQGKLDEALDSLRKGLAIRERLAASDRSNTRWQRDLQASVAGIGNLSYIFILAHNFPRALEASDQAIAAAPTLIWLYANRAHALMFLDRVDEARAVYLRYRDEKTVQGEKSWATVVLEDFAAMRNAGLTHPLMDEIERAFTARG